MRAVKAISKIRSAVSKKDVVDDWELPRRYSHTPEAKLETMLQMVGVLSEITRFSRDYHLSTLLMKFKEAYQQQCSPEARKKKVAAYNNAMGIDEGEEVIAFPPEEAMKYPHLVHQPELLGQLHAIFSKIDVDGSDDLDAGELRDCMKIMGVKLSMAEAKRLLMEVDDDGNGTIDFHEFTVAWSHQSKKQGMFIR
jgi:hypothetical protein